MRVTVVGAGLAGLSAACHLAGQGYDVTVLEREQDVGGRAGFLAAEGFTFDTGPVVMTMPELVADALSAAGAPEEMPRMHRLDPTYRAVYADGSELLVRAEMPALRSEIAARFGEGDAAGFDRFVAWLEALHDTEFGPFIDSNYGSPLDLVRRPRLAARLLRLGGLGSLHERVSSFFADERLTRVFTFQALYAGISPQAARAVLAVITYMDTVRGVFYPEGGMHAVPRSMARALERAGGEIHLDTPVSRILRRADGSVCGVATADGERVAADAVVCTLDLPVAYERLLPGLAPPRRIHTGTYSPSAVVWLVGARGTPAPGTRHHNIHFGGQWTESFTALIDDHRLMPDPSRLVTVPILTDPDTAPSGSSAIYVLEPVPHCAAALDWTREAPRMRERLLAFLDANGYPTDIRTEHLVTPEDWRALGMHLGTPFALAHTFFQSGPFRPRNQDGRVPGLVFAGSGTVPGVGVPMVLISGRLAAERVTDLARSRSRA